MQNKIYIGNLPFSATNDSITETFSAVGTVTSANIIMDKETNRSKGFAFIEMSTAEEAAKAISTFNDKDYNGRNIKVSLAKPREERPTNNRW